MSEWCFLFLALHNGFRRSCSDKTILPGGGRLLWRKLPKVRLLLRMNLPSQRRLETQNSRTKMKGGPGHAHLGFLKVPRKVLLSMSGSSAAYGPPSSSSSSRNWVSGGIDEASEPHSGVIHHNFLRAPARKRWNLTCGPDFPGCRPPHHRVNCQRSQLSLVATSSGSTAGWAWLAASRCALQPSTNSIEFSKFAGSSVNRPTQQVLKTAAFTWRLTRGVARGRSSRRGVMQCAQLFPSGKCTACSHAESDSPWTHKRGAGHCSEVRRQERRRCDARKAVRAQRGCLRCAAGHSSWCVRTVRTPQGSDCDAQSPWG